jgi:hypothetical protein
MRDDCGGVAGFFEDLPVLMFVLAGVFIVVAAGVWTSTTLETQHKRDRLEALAESLVDQVVLEIETRLGGESVPTVDALSRLNLSHVAGGVLPADRFSVAIIERYPEVRWLIQWSDETPESPTQAVGAARLLNALDENLMVAAVEVRAIVW